MLPLFRASVTRNLIMDAPDAIAESVPTASTSVMLRDSRSIHTTCGLGKRVIQRLRHAPLIMTVQAITGSSHFGVQGVLPTVLSALPQAVMILHA